MIVRLRLGNVLIVVLRGALVDRRELEYLMEGLGSYERVMERDADEKLRTKGIAGRNAGVGQREASDPAGSVGVSDCGDAGVGPGNGAADQLPGRDSQAGKGAASGS